MAATNMNLTGIARKLVLDKHLDEAAAVQAVEAANKESMQLTSYLVKNKIVPSNAVDATIPEIYPNLFPQGFSAFNKERFVLDEIHYVASAGKPAGMHTTWDEAIATLRVGNEHVKAAGGYHYTGSLPHIADHNFARAAYSMTYASGARGFGCCLGRFKEGYPVNNSGFTYPEDYVDFVSFAQRFSKYLFHPDLFAVKPDPNGEESPFRPKVHSVTIEQLACDSEEPCSLANLKWEPFQYTLSVDGKFYFIAHLWNQPGDDTMDKSAAPRPAPLTAEVRINQQAWPSYDTAKGYVLSPEFTADGQRWAQPVTVTNTGSINTPQLYAEIQVPAFRHWAIVVFEYPLSSEP